MKKRLLTLGAMAFAMSVNAQFITYVGNSARVYVKQSALVYSGGGVKTIGTGLIDNSGNIMVVGNTNSKFATKQVDGNTDKTDGGNIILRMTGQDLAMGLRYGQLYIKGLTQDNITGIVDKQYKDNAHGTYQQIALPFYNKALNGLNTELGKTFSDKRWTKNEILVWNNKKARFDLLKTSQNTGDAVLTGNRNSNTAYYAIGSNNFNASTDVKTVKGVPYADGITETLEGAGAGIDYGTAGRGVNYYRERYNSYLQDSFDFSNGAWTGNYGKNLYQFGNPYFTNIDLGQLGKELTGLQGVRVEPTGVTTVNRGSTYSTGAKYITYTTEGTAVGDVNAIIKPMQTFVIKLNSAASRTLNFDNLRRFAYTPRAVNTTYKVTAMSISDEISNGASLRSASYSSKPSSSFTVKQLAVLALDANGQELARTYYVVYPNAVTGQPKTASTQVTASASDILGTFEETKQGGYDADLAKSYWLYINEANENDFKGKQVALGLYSEDIKSLKFEIREDAKEIATGEKNLSSGESFYFGVGKNNPVVVKNGGVVPVSSINEDFGLYYGNPNVKNIKEEIKKEEGVVEKPSATFVAFDKGAGVYKLVFDATWKTASVRVYDVTGQLVHSKDNVKTSNHYAIVLPEVKGTYVVNAVSEAGKKFSQKIIK